MDIKMAQLSQQSLNIDQSCMQAHVTPEDNETGVARGDVTDVIEIGR